MCAKTTTKGSASQLTTTPTERTLTVGTWTRDELDDPRLRFYAKRGSSDVNTDYQMRCYGATLTVEYSYNGTLYTVSVTNSATSISVSPSTQEVAAGRTATVDISGDITNVSLDDNGVDTTSSIIPSGNDYEYSIANISADHTLTFTEAIVSTVPFRVKQNGTWVTPTKVLAKSGGSWHEVTKVLVKENGTWKS